MTFYYIYVLQSQKDKRYYTGFAVDLRKRLKEHNVGSMNLGQKEEARSI